MVAAAATDEPQKVPAEGSGMDEWMDVVGMDAKGGEGRETTKRRAMWCKIIRLRLVEVETVLS